MARYVVVVWVALSLLTVGLTVAPSAALAAPTSGPSWSTESFGLQELTGSATYWSQAGRIGYSADGRQLYVAGSAAPRSPEIGDATVAWLASLDSSSGDLIAGPVRLLSDSNRNPEVVDLDVLADGTVVVGLNDLHPDDVEGTPDGIVVVHVDMDRGVVLNTIRWQPGLGVRLAGVVMSPDGTRVALTGANAFRPPFQLLPHRGAYAVFPVAGGPAIVDVTRPEEGFNSPPVWLTSNTIAVGGYAIDAGNPNVDYAPYAEAVDVATSEVRWRWTAPALGDADFHYQGEVLDLLQVTRAPDLPRLLITSRGYVVDGFGIITSLQADTGSVQWEGEIGEGSVERPRTNVSGSDVLVTDGSISTRFDLSSGVQDAFGQSTTGVQPDTSMRTYTLPDGQVLVGLDGSSRQFCGQDGPIGWATIALTGTGFIDRTETATATWSNQQVRGVDLAYSPTTTRFAMAGDVNTCGNRQARARVIGHRLSGVEPCAADVHVIGVRGSGEPANGVIPTVGQGPLSGGESMGRTVTDFFNQFGTALQNRGEILRWTGVSYPAVNALLSAAAGYYPYKFSKDAGVRALRQAVDFAARGCPGQPIILAGYSQGAHVLGDVLQGGTDANWEPLIAGAIMFADPRLNSRDPAVEGTVFINLRPTPPEGMLGARPLFADTWTDRVISYCLSDDFVCMLGDSVGVHTDGYVTSQPGWGITTTFAAGRAVNLLNRYRNSATFAQSPTILADLGGPYRTRPGQEVSVGATASRVSDGSAIVDYAFDFNGDGEIDQRGKSPAATTTYSTSGTRTVSVTVTDQAGRSATATATVDVTSDADLPPGIVDDLTATNILGGVELSWQPTTGQIDRYLVLGDDALLGVTTAEEFTVPLRQPDTITIVAVGPGGVSQAATSASPVPFAPGDVVRIEGMTPAARSAALARRTFPLGAETVVLARDDVYADALAAAAVAGAYGAPVLLTGPDSLDAEVADVIAELGADQAILMGSPAALSDAIVNELDADSIAVERRAGSNRFATAVSAAPVRDQVILVEGGNADPARGWPDAVAASALSAATGWPILLTERDRLPAETAAVLADAETVTIIGGTAAVSEEVAARVSTFGPTVRRLAGPDRYATAVAVADAHLATGTVRTSQVVIATGNDWRDALIAGPAAAAVGSAFVTVNGTADSGGAGGEWVRQRQGREQLLVVGTVDDVSDALAAGLRP